MSLTESHKLGRWNKKYVSSPSFRVWKSKSKGWAGRHTLWRLYGALSRLAVALCLVAGPLQATQVLLLVSLCVSLNFPCYKDTAHIASEAIVLFWVIVLTDHNCPRSFDTQGSTLRCQGSGYQHMNFDTSVCVCVWERERLAFPALRAGGGSGALHTVVYTWRKGVLFSFLFQCSRFTMLCLFPV